MITRVPVLLRVVVPVDSSISFLPGRHVGIAYNDGVLFNNIVLLLVQFVVDKMSTLHSSIFRSLF